MLNAEVFSRDPREFIIPNSGVTTLSTPRSPKEWAVLRWELESFVCEGQYARGLERLLRTYLQRVDEADQPGWWISGFYGSGKSHFVRVLEHLWADTAFPDGSTAREVVTLPTEVRDLLRELDVTGRREGGLWAAAGTLGSGAEGAVRLAFATILFRAAGLPPSYPQARLVLWLTQKGVLDAVKAEVEASDEAWSFALENMFVSLPLASAIHRHLPGFADVAEVRALLRQQFPQATDLSDDEVLGVAEEVMRLRTGSGKSLPCTLVVLDEVQQFIGDSRERVDQVARLAESVTKRFGGKLLLVATGQSAMGATPQLAKIKDRFPMAIELSSADVDQVVRRVILRKKPEHQAGLEAALDGASGEIARHLTGSKLAPQPADLGALVPDYPILPTRRRLWEEFVRAIDRAGSSGQLRSQLRITHEASQEVARRPVGQVVGADFVYRALAGNMVSTGALLSDLYTQIEKLHDPVTDGNLRQRVAQLLFIISKLDARLGVQATEATLADLLVEDLGAGSAGLRARLPEVLRDLVNTGQIMQSGDEYRLQTREGAEWEGDFRSRFNRLKNDEVTQVQRREDLLKKALELALKGQTSVNQGTSKTARKVEVHYAAPPSGTGTLPIWVRLGWNESAADVQRDALAAGSDSPVVFLYLPEPPREALQTQLATLLAAGEVLTARHNPTTPEAREAEQSMRTRFKIAEAEVQRLIVQSIEGARVFQAGGQEQEGGLRGALTPALNASMSRLFPRFPDGDNARWETALRQARQGNHGALEALGFVNEPAKHPVLRAVLTEVGAGRKGSDLRKVFMGVPYGWPQDAVDTALVLLTLENHLKATVNGSAVGAKQLDAATLSKAEFRLENVTLTKGQLLAVRSLYTDIGLKVESGQEVTQAGAYLGTLKSKLVTSGGDAPLPERLSDAPLVAFQGLSGPELLLRMYEAREELKALRAAADARAELIEKRRDHWEKLQRLLRHTTDAELRTRADAIRDGRMLLNDPDPVLPLANEVMNGLRADLSAALDTYRSAFNEGLDALNGLPEWGALPEEMRSGWLSRENLTPLPEQKLGGINEVVDALDRCNLNEWRSTTELVPVRFARVRQRFLESLEPQALTLRPPAATLKSVADAETYLERLRADILKAIDENRPVIIQA